MKTHPIFLLAGASSDVMSEAAKARFFNCGLDRVSGSGRSAAAFGEIRSRRRRACFAAKAIRANWLWGRCWSNGCWVKAQGQIQRSGKREWAIAGNLALFRGDSFVLAHSAVRALAPVSAWPAASKKVAASLPSRIPRQPVTFAWVFSIQGGMKDMLPGNWLREAALHRWATVPWLLPLSTPWSLETALRGSVSVRTSTTFA